MTTKLDVLEYLADHGGAAVASIARHFRLTDYAAQKHIDRLRQQGLVDVRRQLTARGRARLKHVAGDDEPRERGVIRFR